MADTVGSCVQILTSVSMCIMRNAHGNAAASKGRKMHVYYVNKVGFSQVNIK